MNDSSTLVNSVEFAMLPVEERVSVLEWQKACEAVDRADSKLAECRSQSMLHAGVKGWKNPRAVQRTYYKWVRAGRNWRVLVNGSKMPHVRPEGDSALGEAFKTYVERNQRNARRGHAALLADLRSGSHIVGVGDWRDVWRAEFPRVAVPVRCPADWIPRGWVYETMLRKFPLTSHEKAAARVGAVAADQFIPPVYSTRVGMRFAAEYQFDDMWDDILVSVPGVNARLVRPLQYRCIDRFTTHLVSYGMKPQILRDDKTREGLGKGLFKATICDVLCNHGYHPEGTVFVIEHGTASLSEEECDKIKAATGGRVTFRRSDVKGRQIVEGAFPGQGHGNFKAKALLESLHRLPHFAAAALPGQTGGNSRDGSKPESLYGLEAYADKILAAYERIPPAIRNQVNYGGALPFALYRNLMFELYEIIDCRHDHRIEGWDDLGFVKEMWSFDGVTGWRPASDIDELPEFSREPARRALVTPGFHKAVRLSPREAWEAGAGSLVRLPPWALIDFLGDDCFRTVRVGSRKLMEFQDRDLFGTAQTLRYLALCVQPDGTGVWLREGAEYGLYVLPHDASKAVVVDAVRRNVLGMVTQWTSAQPMNAAQVEAAIASQNLVRAMANAPIRERHQLESDVMLSERTSNSVLLEGIFEETAAGGLRRIREKVPAKSPAKTQNQSAAMGAIAALRQSMALKETGEEDNGSEW